jgi:calcineurin-like phosphoesterase family protein
MSDIHGCYDEFMSMLEKIAFSDEDHLIIAGDYIDRGRKSYEMLRWIERKPHNVKLLMGNHDKEFAYNVQLMKMVIKKNGLNADINSVEQTEAIYELTAQLAVRKDGTSFF